MSRKMERSGGRAIPRRNKSKGRVQKQEWVSVHGWGQGGLETAVREDILCQHC